jgi:nucleoside-diphosphate-sugar epimerase
LVHAAEVDTELLGARRNLTMPSISVTVQDQIDALDRVAGTAAVDLIERRPDAAVASIVAGWPERFATDRADALGFACESTYDEIIEAYLEDDAPAAGEPAGN